ncbi:MAG: ImmA/IrrE family metallo-endopeptidase [gamma proteobacterium endosymbiont of Lamellibrachia anaximandri]|nr:ImmA/IrrE family metallo-endopeptidase [gamma proteobacterium endosymbiont of Lamellibrachia anaximandri]MBL3618147.1 ImmA/IrrE family metallo-endopeptidase [gamma proteobacterium endosymbiont of Lamellibrachia anaximandri]
MDHIKVIKSEQGHEQALARLMSLMDADPAPGSREGDELDVLAFLIERYEQEQFPMDTPDPIEAIKFRMEQQGLRNKDLVPYFGSASKASEVLNGKRKLSLNMIRKLTTGLGIPAEVLIREPVQLLANESEIDWQAFPLSDMRKRGYFDGFTGTLQELREYAAETVSKLLSSVAGGFDLQPAMLRSTAHLRSNDKKTDPYALWAWQVRVLQKAQEEQLPTNYEKGTVDREWMQKLTQLSWSEQGPQLAIEYLNRSGIHLVFEQHLSKTYLDGAVCMNANGNPVIALTLRYDKLDNFWFTLMHELAHIALHLDGTEIWFIDDLDAVGVDKKESEADALAQESLVPREAWSNLHFTDPDSVRALARSLNISPCIIAGRLRHEHDNHMLFGKLFREKIRERLSEHF